MLLQALIGRIRDGAVMRGRWWCAMAVVLGVAAGRASAGDVYSHIVVVIEENHSASQVIGNLVDAPYINTLAAGGVSFDQMYAITHPSQPNYLQFFSGGDQGIKNDSSASTVFTAPNLAASLMQAGRTFTGYSETLPSVGYAGSSYTTVSGQNQYVRKHNPWVNWQSASPTGNQLPASVNQPFTSFPTEAGGVAGYASLPDVSIVVPNEQNDMHDGTIKMGDDWMVAHLSGYAEWAKANNSLLVITFDEDNSASNNRIPTVMYGAGLMNGTTVKSTYTLHNLLQTIGTWAGGNGAGGVAAPGLGAKTRVMYGPLASLGTPTVRTFQQNVGGYAGTLTNNIKAITPTTPLTGATTLLVDNGAGTDPAQVLIKFSDVFGSGAAQVPAGAEILSAKLVFTTNAGASNPFSVDAFRLYRMVQAWGASSTYNSFGGNGVNADGMEAETDADYDFDVLPYATANALGIFDVTDTVQGWSEGAANNGWVLMDYSGTDGWRMFGEGASAAPRLEVTYAMLPAAVDVPEPGTLGVLGLGVLLAGCRRRRPAGR
jgi:acid phosphatase